MGGVGVYERVMWVYMMRYGECVVCCCEVNMHDCVVNMHAPARLLSCLETVHTLYLKTTPPNTHTHTSTPPYTPQRFGQASMFKRTVLQHIAEDLLTHAIAPGSTKGLPQESVVPLQRGTATPLVTLPTDSPMLFLYEQLGFVEGVEEVDRSVVEAGLMQLGMWGCGGVGVVGWCMCVCWVHVEA